VEALRGGGLPALLNEECSPRDEVGEVGSAEYHWRATPDVQEGSGSVQIFECLSEVLDIANSNCAEDERHWKLGSGGGGERQQATNYEYECWQ